MEEWRTLDRTRLAATLSEAMRSKAKDLAKIGASLGTGCEKQDIAWPEEPLWMREQYSAIQLS